MNREITLGSLFDGIAGFPLAAERNGIKPVWASEIEPFPIAVSKQSFPYIQHLGDIKNLDGRSVPPADIVTGGSPCQNLSVAGRREGLYGSQSSLFFEQIRIIKEMRTNDIKAGRKEKDIRPRIMVWENVPGTFSSSKGEDFRRILEEICKIADKTITIPGPSRNKWFRAGCIMGEDFSLAWRVLDARYWGVPQRRRRIFLVADFGGHCAPEILFELCCLQGDTKESESNQQTTAKRFRESARESVEKELKVLPFDTSFILSPQNQSILQFGDPCHALVAKSHIPKVVIENRYGISENTINKKPEDGGHGMGINENTSYTLNATDRHAICSIEGDNEIATFFCEHIYHSWKESDISATLRSSGGSCGGGSENLAMTENIVRKLTPLECERLQGFPNNWTLLENKEDFSDEDFSFWKNIYSIRKNHGKEPSQKQVLNWYNKLCSDSARYKALGNSAAIPCVEFIIKRIKEVCFKEGNL